jgi:coenzyme F420-reducing hydrogenase alpha subunit
MDKESEDLKQEVDGIKETVNEIKKTVDNIEKLEESEITHILNVKDMESEELSNLDNLKDLENQELDKLHKIGPKKFKDVMTWKQMIWESCKERKMNDSMKVVSFSCNLTNKVCSFELCPKNKVNEISTKK